jgi:hypothetical protein
MSCNLQDWIEISKALLTPVIAAFGTWLGYQQHKTSREKLKLDLFDRRYKVYFCMASCLEEVAREGNVNDAILYRFSIGTRDVPFLFNSSIVELEKKIFENLNQLKYQENQIGRTTNEVQSMHFDKSQEIKNWLNAQLKNLQENMAPWLKFSNLE